MSGTEATYHLTEADIQKAESRASKQHGGDVPKGSEAAMMQSIIDKAEKDKAEIIAERQANLPLPDQPPVPSDFNSADQRTVNVGSGGEPTAEIDATGREARDNLGGIPNDAVTQAKKNNQGLVDTTNTDPAAERAAGAN